MHNLIDYNDKSSFYKEAVYGIEIMFLCNVMSLQ